MAMNYYDKFVAKLQEIFMMDHAELDFGIYRIMNQKRDEIQHFLQVDLLPQVKQALQGDGGNTQQAKQRMAEIEQMFAGMDIETLPDSNPNVAEYKKLKAQLAQGGNAEDMEGEVFSHLVTFFSRYYDGGDFLSKRRYKDNTYAIPYNGEEVKLHWANSDQYYIKTSEYFRNYTFVLPTSRKKIHFVLKDASTEQNNNRAANNMERRFALWEPENAGDQVIEVTADGELNIYFTYELMPKATKQKDLLAAALETITPLVPADFEEVLTAKAPTKDNPNRTLLEKHLTDYTAKNSFDYFIHKDLGGFLSRELDFYIKNEVLHIDDLDPQHINNQLSVVKAIKQVGQKIIQMLAQLENFQKKLWLKKKFVVQSDYCITLDRVPTIEFLKQNKFLVLDTAFFDGKFKHQLVKSMENIDEQTNGLLINSENFQALELLQEKYKNRVNGIYIDPPYNAKSSEILYKNTYKDSSWNSFIHNRVSSSYNLLQEDSIFQFAIDDYEVHNSILLLNQIFGSENHLGNVTVMHNPRGRNDDKFYGTAHEYMLTYSKNCNLAEIGLFPLTDDDREQYRQSDGLSNFTTVSFIRTGNNSRRFERPNLFYPIYVKPDTLELSTERKDGWIETLPIVGDEERTWRWGVETFELKKDTEIVCKYDPSGYNGYKLYKKRRDEGVGKKPKTVWFDSKYDASTHGIMYLRKLYGEKDLFSYPKSINTVFDTLTISSKSDSIILDYFAGSGTTADAIIKLNKKDGEEGERKYILCEMGNYFDSVTRTRVEKVIHSQDWRDGKPVSRNLLDTETRDSLLNLKWFENPFEMTLKTTKDNELVPTKVDMVETFNYLIGLNVETEDWYQDDNICVVQGKTHREGLKTLVIWRNCKVVNNDQLCMFFDKMDFRTRDTEFDLIYVNGDNTLPNLKRDEDHWKVVLTEEEFAKRMFEEN